jgi:uridine kinase
VLGHASGVDRRGFETGDFAIGLETNRSEFCQPAPPCKLWRERDSTGDALTRDPLCRGGLVLSLKDDADLIRTRLLAANQLQANHLQLVAIDGLGGAGKSTLAEELLRLLPNANVVHMDDFYRPLDVKKRLELDAEGGYRTYFDWERLETQVLRPLRQQRVARYKRYDWGSQHLEEWHEVEPTGVVLVEGVYSSRPELRAYYDLAIWVDVGREERLRRQRLRAQEDEEWIKRWDQSELWYQTNLDPERNADMIVRAC